MKLRLLSVLFAALLAVVLAGCDTAEPSGLTDTTAAGETTAAELAAPPTVYGFVSGETLLYAGADPAVLAALGEPQDKLEAPSCVHPGFDRIYYYAGFEVNTQPTAAGGEVIVSVYLTDDSVSTPEGIYIGATLDAVKAAYGETAPAADNAMLYRYTKTDAGVTGTVNFLVDANGTVTSIYYN